MSGKSSKKLGASSAITASLSAPVNSATPVNSVAPISPTTSSARTPQFTSVSQANRTPSTTPPQISWDQYFMDIAHQVARRSKDPSSQNGCIIVDQNHRPISFGYNGLIQGANESKMTLEERPMKYFFSVHSEMNALIFARRDLTGCTLYNCIATCENCLKHCLQAGITRFVYANLRVNSYHNCQSHACSMTSLQTDEAIIRMLSSLPHIQTLNLTNGKTYIEDILAQYPPDSKEHQQLTSWL